MPFPSTLLHALEACWRAIRAWHPLPDAVILVELLVAGESGDHVLQTFKV